MKRIIALCAVLALLTPAYAFAHGDTMYRLQKKWQLEQAQEQRELPSIKGIKADVAKAMKSFQTCKICSIQQEPINSK